MPHQKEQFAGRVIVTTNVMQRRRRWPRLSISTSGRLHSKQADVLSSDIAIRGLYEKPGRGRGKPGLPQRDEPLLAAASEVTLENFGESCNLGCRPDSTHSGLGGS